MSKHQCLLADNCKYCGHVPVTQDQNTQVLGIDPPCKAAKKSCVGWSPGEQCPYRNIVALEAELSQHGHQAETERVD